jgi:hypothetical protein
MHDAMACEEDVMSDARTLLRTRDTLPLEIDVSESQGLAQ